MTVTKIRVGIVGYGGAGSAHENYFRSIRGCQVTKILDVHAASRQRAEALPRTRRIYESPDGFWDDLDLVSVCVPDRKHADYIVEALGRGINVVCEKPLTDSHDGIRRVLAAEASSEATAAVLHQMRFVPLFQEMKKAINAGRLGNISYVEGYYVHNLRDRAYQNTMWRFEDNATPIVYAGCHFVDLLRWLVPSDIVEVFAAGNHLAFPEYPESDLNVITLRFANGVLGKVLVSFGSACPQDHSVRVYGDAGCIDNSSLFGTGGRELTLHRPTVVDQLQLVRSFRKVGWPRRASQEIARTTRARLADGAYGLLRRLGPDADGEYGFRHAPMRLYEHRLACVRALEDVVAAIREARPPLCTLRDSAQTVNVCLAALESLRTNEVVTVGTLASHE